MPEEKNFSPFKRITAEDLYEVIKTQTFEEWHNKRFENHISGWGNPSPTKEEILQDIRKMFKVD